jgi:GAF domain-containing protein
MTRSIEFYYRFAAENMAYHVLQTMMPMAAAVLLFTFTPLRLLNIRPGRWIAAGAALGLSLIAGNAIVYPRYAAYGILTTNGFRVWASLMLVLVLVSIPLNLWMRLGGVQLSPTDRLRTRILSGSMAISFLLPSAYAFLLTLTNIDVAHNVSYKVVSESSILLFPFLIGYAVVRHNLLRLSELAREALLFTLLMTGVTALYVGVTTAAVPVAERLIPESETWFRPLAFAFVLAFVTPLHQRARHWAEKRFNRLPFEFEAFLESLSHIEQTANSPFEFAQEVVAEVARLVKSRRVAFLSRFPGHDQWVLSAMIPLPRTGNTTDSCQSLLALLEQEKHELHRDEIVDNIEYEHLKQQALEGFVSLEATAIFPLMSRGRVIGALAVGEKTTGGNFSMPELRALRRIGQHVAGVLFNLMGKQISEGNRRIVDIYPNCPEKIGAYTIVRVLGEGGMSYVYLGELRGPRYLGEQSGPRYAIKVPNRMIQASSVLMERFHREASAIQQLRHPNIVDVREIGWMGPEPYMVLEYFEHGSLDEVIEREGPLSERDALAVVRDVARGLAFALEAGVIHRDIKPKNLFRANNGTVKIGDFGLARLADMTSITATGEFFGTADYLSPEIVEGREATWLSDQYALGVTLFYLLTGQVPFKAATAQAAVYRRLNEPPPDPRSARSDLSEESARLALRLMAREPAERFTTYTALLAEIEVNARLSRTGPN